jgi:hypothetical protein
MQLPVLRHCLAQATQVHSLANLKCPTSGERRVVVGRVLDLSGSVSDSSRIPPPPEKGPYIYKI